MSQYEITFLLVEEEELANIKKLFDSFKAIITSETAWGKKTLAYPINKNLAAYYFNCKFDIVPNSVVELKRKLNFDEKLLRYLLLKSET